MDWKTWWAGIVSPPAFDGHHGRPPSGNGASSFHLFWQHGSRRWVAAEATIEIVTPPVTDDLYFWALQVNLHDGRRGTGGAHLGPQSFSLDPAEAAINWGGYGDDGQELAGTTSALPSRDGNPNTRRYEWRAGRPYRLRASWAGPGPRPGVSAWRGEVTDLVSGDITHVRDLYAPGDRIDTAMVWSEIFAPCDAPGVVVRWSDLALIDDAGTRVPVVAASVNYQSRSDGGCETTDSSVEVAAGVPALVQRTGTIRRTPPGAELRLDRPVV